MFQPNADCILFCDWLLNVSWQPLSNSQRLIVQAVQSAAVANTPITNNTWTNFNKFTSWRYPYYKVYSDLATFTDPTLLTDLLLSYSFEGNANDDTGNFPGTASNITFGTPYGRVLQGANFNGINSQITSGPLTIAAGNTYAFWVRFDATGGSVQYVWANSVSGSSFNYNKPTQDLLLSAFSLNTTCGTCVLGAWHFIVVVISATHITTYNNNTLVISNPYSAPSTAFNQFGQFAGANYFKGDLDIVCSWTRELSVADISTLYNSGAGLQYPF